MTTEQKTGLSLLRVPFPAHLISKLPKPACKLDDWNKLPKGQCKECGGYHATSKTIHLDFVGHAALTDRLLDADPAWNWEPVAIDDNGSPKLDKDGGMWIKLTVCGVTRLGYGDAQGKAGGNATKERIGDALRNAAMRFGAALDLWSKADLHGNDGDDDDDKKKTPPPIAKELPKTEPADKKDLAFYKAKFDKFNTAEEANKWAEAHWKKVEADLSEDDHKKASEWFDGVIKGLNATGA